MPTARRTPSSPLRIGLVGGWGHESVAHYPGARLAWACDYDDKARERASRGGHPIFPSMEELISEFHPHLIYAGSVFARNGLVAAEALERNLPVVSEKPLAADWATLARLRELTADGKRHAIAEFAMRWSTPFAKARELAASHAIGEITLIRASKSYKFGSARPDFYRLRESFGGIIPWVASHAIDYAAWSAGLTFRQVTAQHDNRSHPDYAEMEDHAAMLFEMNNGAPCVIAADFLRPSSAPSHGDNLLHLTGTSGTVEVRNSEVTLTTATRQAQWHLDSGNLESVRRAEDLVHAAFGESAPISTEESLHITAAALAARESADLHRSNGVLTAIPISPGGRVS